MLSRLNCRHQRENGSVSSKKEALFFFFFLNQRLFLEINKSRDKTSVAAVIFYTQLSPSAHVCHDGTRLNKEAGVSFTVNSKCFNMSFTPLFRQHVPARGSYWSSQPPIIQQAGPVNEFRAHQTEFTGVLMMTSLNNF